MFNNVGILVLSFRISAGDSLTFYSFPKLFLLSTSQFSCGYLGFDVMCNCSHCAVKLWNLFHTKYLKFLWV